MFCGTTFNRDVSSWIVNLLSMHSDIPFLQRVLSVKAPDIHDSDNRLAYKHFQSRSNDDASTTTLQPGTAATTTSSEKKCSGSFTLSHVYLRLKGAPQLTEAALRAFERATETLYISRYHASGASQRYLLEPTDDDTVSRMAIRTTDEALNTLRKTLPHDQTFRFMLGSGPSENEVMQFFLEGLFATLKRVTKTLTTYWFADSHV